MLSVPIDPKEQLVKVVVGVVFFITAVFDVEVTFTVELSGLASTPSDCVAANIRSSSVTSSLTSDINCIKSKSGGSLVC